MRRFYEKIIWEHFFKHRQMLFLMGPRQAGKTTTSLMMAKVESAHTYLNWDVPEHRELIRKGPQAVASFAGCNQLGTPRPILVLDEIHKGADWKLFLKGFYDLFADRVHLLVTGSARLDVYQRGGDSLMGRYLAYRFHPLSFAELLNPSLPRELLQPTPPKIEETGFKRLLQFGGYPDPFIKSDKHFLQQWHHLRMQQLFREDLRDLTRVQELDRLELLAELIRQQVGQLTSFESFARKLRVTNKTVRRWVEILKRVYYCYSLRPWSTNVTRSLLKEPKFYLWDWSACLDPGARSENMIASHLLKAVHFWTDYGYGEFGLYFLRDKEKREIDFIVTRDRKPWFLVEVKNGEKELSRSLCYFQDKLQASHALQVSMKLPFVADNCFASPHPIIVPATTFLAQLV